MPQIVHFEIGADNLDRAAQFYRHVFGWQIGAAGPQGYRVVMTGSDSQPPISGGIFERRGPIGWVAIIGVPALDEALQRVTEKGGKIMVSRVEVAKVGYLAYCEDTEGNLFGILQEDRTAAQRGEGT